jgi:hypothetical protein
MEELAVSTIWPTVVGVYEAVTEVELPTGTAVVPNVMDEAAVAGWEARDSSTTTAISPGNRNKRRKFFMGLLCLLAASQA